MTGFRRLSIAGSIYFLILTSGCFPLYGAAAPAEGDEVGQGVAEGVQIEDEAFDTVLEPVVVPDPYDYEAIRDQYYLEKNAVGSVFVQTTAVITNLDMQTVADVPFVMHPNQSLDWLSFSNPNQPVVVTGYGNGWGSIKMRGEGNVGEAICTCEYPLAYELTGLLTPAPGCTLDIDLIAFHFTEQAQCNCEWSVGITMTIMVDEMVVDDESMVNAPIVFVIPDTYKVVHDANPGPGFVEKSEYYLRWFYPTSRPGTVDPGCGKVNLEDPELSLKFGLPFDIALTPESKRTEEP